MKNLSAVVSMIVLFAACVAEPAQDQVAQSASAVEKPPAMPAAAAKAMKDAGSLNLTPIFVVCPYYLTYTADSFDENGNEVYGWLGIELDVFVADKPTVSTFGTTKFTVCGTTQSPHSFMSVRKALPAGYTTCTTSAVGTAAAWFVCT
jgi:hypothetical protein